jgi:hypothetical protein
MEAMEQKQLKFVLVAFFCICLMGFFSLYQVALTAVNATTAVWYDATQGGTPDSQNMEYAESNGFSLTADAEQAFVGGATILTSTTTIEDYAGYGIDGAVVPIFVAADGFKMSFTVQVIEDIHTRAERSGFSVILLDNNALGIELGFHEGAIYAREGNGANLFEYAEDVAFNTTKKTSYELAILNNVYTLYVGGTAILTGSVRDYSDNVMPLPILPDPYEQPNFVFLGDNTTSGSAIIKLWYVSTTTGSAAPFPPTSTPTVTAMATATNTAVPTNTPAAKISLPLIYRAP